LNLLSEELPDVREGGISFDQFAAVQLILFEVFTAGVSLA
jgi:hypothetical protein